MSCWRRPVDGAVFNHYGPTETTIGVATGRLEPVADGVVPVGSPVANTRCYVLDGGLAAGTGGCGG